MVPEQTFIWLTASEWTAIGTMIIAVVAIGVGVAEWRRSQRDRREGFERDASSLFVHWDIGLVSAEDGAMRRVTIKNNAERGFDNLQLIYQPSLPDGPTTGPGFDRYAEAGHPVRSGRFAAIHHFEPLPRQGGKDWFLPGECDRRDTFLVVTSPNGKRRFIPALS